MSVVDARPERTVTSCAVGDLHRRRPSTASFGGEGDDHVERLEDRTLDFEGRLSLYAADQGVDIPGDTAREPCRGPRRRRQRRGRARQRGDRRRIPSTGIWRRSLLAFALNGSAGRRWINAGNSRTAAAIPRPGAHQFALAYMHCRYAESRSAVRTASVASGSAPAAAEQQSVPRRAAPGPACPLTEPMSARRLRPAPRQAVGGGIIRRFVRSVAPGIARIRGDTSYFKTDWHSCRSRKSHHAWLRCGDLGGSHRDPGAAAGELPSPSHNRPSTLVTAAPARSDPVRPAERHEANPRRNSEPAGSNLPGSDSSRRIRRS